MMSHLLKTDKKLINGLVRLYWGSGVTNGGSQIRNDLAFGCPNCGVGLRTFSIVSDDSRIKQNAFHYSRRLLSTKPSSSPISAPGKKSRKKAKKSTKCTTEIITENRNAALIESETQLQSMKPNDLVNYLGKLSVDSSSSKIVGSSMPSYNNCMLYSTSGFNPLSILTFAGASDISNSSPITATLMTEGVEETLNDGGYEEGSVTITKESGSKSKRMIPDENDLIGCEFDVNSKFKNKSSVEGENKKVGTVQHADSSGQPIVKPGVKKKAKKKTKVNAEDKESLAKIKMEEMTKLAKEVSLNKSLVAYLDTCVFIGHLNRGLQTLTYYRHRSKHPPHPSVTDVNSYNYLMHGFAHQSNLSKVKDIFNSLREEGLKPSVQSYAAVLECLGRLPSTSPDNHQYIKSFIDQLVNDGFALHDLFNKTTFTGDQREMVIQAVRRIHKDFVPKLVKPSTRYNCPLLKDLNNISTQQPVISPAKDLISLDKLNKMATKQLQMELKGTVTIKSVENKLDKENLPHYRKALQEVERKWAQAIKEAIERNFVTLVNQGQKYRHQKTIGLYPFLKVLKPDDYVMIINQEIRRLAEGSETYSPGVSQLYRELGTKVLARYQVLYKKKRGISEKVQQMYSEYIHWYLNPTIGEMSEIRNPRQKWQQLIYDANSYGPNVDIEERTWPNSVLSSIGRFLYGIIMQDIKIDAQIMKPGTKSEHSVPAFYSIFRMQGVHLKEEIKPHPVLVKLFQAASRDELTFDATHVPMLSPPLPWASIRTGGYLLTPAKIIRLPFQAHQQQIRLQDCREMDLYPSLDSLNQLGAVPWKINHMVLDTVIAVFNNKGDDSLEIPPPASECPLPPTIDASMTRQEKLKVHKTRLALKRKKAEMYSLWCDALYRLSLANHFRKDIFWFPHNMDFRGRVYPCPPHLNHLGADMARSILVFAQGQPLGKNGLNWLKVHLINLTGLKKRDSVEERLKYADEILDDIFDSADNPLGGRKWWTESDEPWQTLACCIEIANAIRSGDPTSYICHFPVHQDGSCNGLQHYAALGRDQAGAESVNLAPSSLPQDVYSSIATLVEKLREKDAIDGIEVAQVLEGFIKRKVIKQTVMTTVYGVTKYGARLQIAKQLKDIPNFPKEHIWAASLYLVGRTFDSLQEMFTSTKEIQDWFTECAKLISQICGQNVEWVTPLGLPVVQPYFRPSKKVYEGFDPVKLPELHVFDAFERPNVMKQKNAFPPNFVHSLDSSHMMLTSLFSEQTGITFVSVHDCYWTHPCSVEIMNKICREQFVALHSEPILENLSKFLVKKYSYKESEFFKDGSITDSFKHKLNRLLTEVPAKGSFDLNSVLKSTYFFS